MYSILKNVYKHKFSRLYCSVTISSLENNSDSPSKLTSSKKSKRKSNVFHGRITSYNQELKGIVQPEDIDEKEADGTPSLIKPTSVINSMLGEKVQIRVFNKSGDLCEARAYEIIEKSPERIDQPKCQHYGLCSGCSIMHMSPKHQVYHKHQQLEKLYREASIIPNTGSSADDKTSILDREVLEIVDGNFGYRRRARFMVRMDHQKKSADSNNDNKNIRVNVGYNSALKTSFQVNRCPILVESVQTLPQKLSDLFSEFDHSIKSKIPAVELTVADNATSIIIRHMAEIGSNDLEKIKVFAQQENLVVYLQSGGPETITQFYPTDHSVQLYYNSLDDKRQLEIGPTDFMQINKSINKEMIRQAINYLNLKKSDYVYELFCGSGNFTFSIAELCEFVVAIDYASNSLVKVKPGDNVESIGFNLYEKSISYNSRCNKVLLDPPKSGAEKVCNEMPENLEAIVYISCSPGDSLIRDLQILKNKGYKVKKIKLIEMFPNTSKMEAIVLLEP